MIIKLYAFANFLTTVVSILLGVFVYIKNRRIDVNRATLLIGISVGCWSFGFAFLCLSGDRESALFWARLSHVGAIFIPSFFIYFAFAFVGLYQQKRRFVYLGYGVSLVLVCLSYSDKFISDVVPKLNFPYYFKPGPIYYIFTFFFFWMIIYAHAQAMRTYKTLSGFNKLRMKYAILASVIGFGGGFTTFPLVFDIPLFPFGGCFVFLYSIITAYAIAKYRLMDIKLVITRAGIFVAVYTLVLGIPFAIGGWLKPLLATVIGVNWWFVPLGIMALLATTGPFVYIYLDRKAEEKLFQEQKRYQDTLKRASLGMTRIRDLKKLLKLIVYTVTRSVRINYASIYILDKENSHFNLGAVRDSGDKALSPQISADTPLVGWLKNNQEPLVFEEVKRELQDNPTQELEEVNNQMVSLKASVIVPSLVEDKLLGFMVLGDKRSGEIYTKEDLQVFTVLANQAALAIENARFFEEAKVMQDQISQAEKMATIGTMADGLSHQINNRFHALSLIAGDTLDTLKLTDATNYSQEQKDLLMQIKHALERIQSNVMQGGEVVKGMLKYTRKGEEGFSAIKLDDIVNSTVEMLQYKIKVGEIDIIKDYPKDTPAVKGNLTQLQEVFFNLIDNAYDAMTERRYTLKEEGYRGKVRIYSEAAESGFLKICVEDNGLGVKSEDFKKMFTPFFTTKTSSNRGTGLGLYVIKKIITSNHSGRISVESNYKQGTKFIVELPLAV